MRPRPPDAGRTRAGDAGFTLLELLAAITVLGVVLALLGQGAWFGLRVTRAQAALGVQRGDIEAVDRALRRMVAQADPGIYPEPPNFRGGARVVSFTTELPLHGVGPAARADVAVSVEAGRLLLRWTPRRHVEAFGPAPVPEETALLDGVERIEFAYRGAGAPWAAAWEADRLPALIRLRLVFADGSGRRWPPIVAAFVREASEE